MSPDLRAVVCPTLIIHGEESELVSEDEVDQAVTELRRGRLETVPGGHAVLWDALAESSALGARVRADCDACVSLRLRAMTGPEFDAWRAAAPPRTPRRSPTPIG